MSVSEPPIPWERVDAIPNVPDYLFAQVDEHVSVGLRTDEEGDFVVSFVVGFRSDRRPLPEVEAWIRRASAFLEDLP